MFHGVFTLWFPEDQEQLSTEPLCLWINKRHNQLFSNSVSFPGCRLVTYTLSHKYQIINSH